MENSDQSRFNKLHYKAPFPSSPYYKGLYESVPEGLRGIMLCSEIKLVEGIKKVEFK